MYKVLLLLLALPQLTLANPQEGYKVVEYQSAEENRVNPHFQTFLSGCGEGLLTYLEQADKIEFLDNGKEIHLSSVETEWQPAPGTFGELGGEVEVSSKLERIVYFKQGQCTTRKVNNPFTLSKKTRISYADKGLMTCASTVLEIDAMDFKVGNLTERLVKEYPEVPAKDGSLNSTQRKDYIHHYEVSNEQGEVVGLLEHRFRRDLHYIVMGHTDIESTQTELDCSFKKF